MYLEKSCIVIKKQFFRGDSMGFFHQKITKYINMDFKNEFFRLNFFVSVFPLKDEYISNIIYLSPNLSYLNLMTIISYSCYFTIFIKIHFISLSLSLSLSIYLSIYLSLYLSIYSYLCIKEEGRETY